MARAIFCWVALHSTCAIESNTIAVYIHQLRKKLGDGVIVTVHGFGYRLDHETTV